MSFFKVISKYDGQMKFHGTLFLCNKWVYEHGNDWLMHEIVKEHPADTCVRLGITLD